MSFSSGGGSGALSSNTDVAFSNVANGQTMVFNGTLGKWQNAAPTGGAALDATDADIAPLGVAAAGSVGKAADAGHVHAMPRLDQVVAPTAAVALNAQKITGLANGSVASDAATFGQIPVAGTTAGTFTAGNDSRIAAAAQLGSDSTIGGPTGSPLSNSIVTGVTKSVTGTYTILPSDHVLLMDATSGAFTATLPTAVGFAGRITLDAITASTNLVTIATVSGQTIDGASTTTIGSSSSTAAWLAVDLVSDGANWRTV